MPSFKSVLAASTVALFASSNAHMILLTPPPYGTPNSSPLEGTGSNYPCKSTSNSGGPVTNMAIGQQQQLSFKGSAVHGGGSCQVALTTDNPATKNSKWMVIHSIEGGCPAKNQGGNMGDDPNATGADKFNYKIPEGISPGTYTLAWTWFNRIGNREMYMNCANIKVTGGSSKRDIPLNETEQYAVPELTERATPDFPPLFLANIPTTDCTTPDSMNVKFPNPGKSVETNAGAGQQLSPPTGPKCSAGGASGGSSSSGSPSGIASGGAASAGSPAPNSASGGAAAAPAPAAGGSSGGTDSEASPQSGGSSPAASSPSAPATPAAPSTAPAAPMGNSSSGSASSGSSASLGSGSGSSPGSLLCSPDGKQFAIATAGGAPTFQPVAAGTKCQGGAIAMAKEKRSAKFNSRYIRRNFAGNFN